MFRLATYYHRYHAGAITSSYKSICQKQINLGKRFFTARPFTPTSSPTSQFKELANHATDSIAKIASPLLCQKDILAEVKAIVDRAQKISDAFSFYHEITEVIKKNEPEEHVRVEIARLCAQQNVFATAPYIKNFGIKDQAALLEIAKLCVQQHGFKTARDIEDFGIKGQAALIDIAKLCAQQESAETAYFIKNFGIKDQAALIEIARLCAQQDSHATAYAIEDFGITDQVALIEIARLCAQQNGFATAHYIENFGIKDQSTFIEIARLCVLQKDSKTVCEIKKFDTTDPSTLIETAKLYAQHADDAVCYAIFSRLKEFGITDQAALVEIAKLYALQKDTIIARYIKKFNIIDQAALIDIAKLCAQQEDSETAYYIKNFGITDQAALIDIAKLCAQQEGSETAYYIKNFGITDRAALVEIVKLCLLDDCKVTLDHFEDFNITDYFDCMDIAKFHVANSRFPKALYISERYLERYTKGRSNEELIANLRAWKNALFGNLSLAPLFNQIEAINDQALMQSKLRLLEIIFFILDVDLPKELIQSNGLLQLISATVNFSAPELRLTLFKGVIEAIIHHNKFFEIAEHLTSKNEQDWMVLIRFMLTIFCLNGLRQDVAKQLIEATSSRSASLFHNGPQQRVLIEMLFHFGQELSLTLAEKERLLELVLVDAKRRAEEKAASTKTISRMDVIKAKKAQDKLLFAQEILQQIKSCEFYKLRHSIIESHLVKKEDKERLSKSKDTEELKRYVTNFATAQNIEHWRKTSQSLENVCTSYGQKEFEKECLRSMQVLLAILLFPASLGSKEPTETLEKTLEQLLHKALPFGRTENLIQGYTQNFTLSRAPAALAIYTAKIASLGDQKALTCLGQFVTAVVNGDFEKQRNDQADNLHLKTIATACPHVLEKWREPQPPIPLHLGQETVFDGPLFKHWLHQKLVCDHHLTLTNPTLNILQTYLTSAKADSSENWLYQLQAHAGKTPNEQDCLLVQKSCLQLCHVEATDSQKKIDLLTKMETLCVRNLVSWQAEEFIRDIQGMQKDLARPARRSNLSVVDTTDPLDLLLCGTEISGSCQSVNGNADFNKGLLGYLMDGKIRLLATKDDKGRIVARCLLKLMWDGEEPVIYQERIYPATAAPNYQQALHGMAKQKAKTLGLKLAGEHGQAYGKVLKALGGNAPWEYSDAACGVKKRGIYEISDARI